MKILEKIIEYGFYLFIFLLPWQIRWIWQPGQLNQGSWEYGTFSFYGTEFLLLAILILGFIWILGRPKPEKNEQIDLFNYYIIIFVLILASFISTYWAKDQQLTLYAFIKLLEGLGLFGLIMSINFTFRRIAWTLVSSACLQSFLAIYQFLSQSVMGNKWLGIATQLPFAGGVSVVEDTSGRWLRAYGALPHPNILGGFLAISLLLLIGLAFASKKKREKIIIFAVYVIVTAALFLTFSRESWIGFAVAIVFLLYIILQSRNRELKLILANFILISVMVAGLFSIFFPNEILMRVGGGGRLEVKSTEERVSYYNQAYQLISEKLFNPQTWYQGTGIGNYTLAVHDDINKNLYSWDYQPVHNLYVLMFAELGIEGMLVFLLLLYKIIKEIKNERLIKHKEILVSAKNLSVNEVVVLEKKFDYWFLVFSAMIIAIAVISLFDHYFWTIYFGIMIFWLAIGLWLRNFKSSRYNYI